MPAIFISHSSHDGAAADEIKSWLAAAGFDRVFLDFDKDTGIGAGEAWERRLYEEVARCHAVILVLTPNWLSSTWCRVELAQARALGKVIVPVIVSALDQRVVLPEIQAVDLVDWNESGLQRIAERLHAITDELARGFTLAPHRPPYPGIHAFEAEDAAIFFGRDDEVRAVIERLEARRSKGGARLVLIIGASGAGKSSVLKAGVLPQLARRRDQWVVLPAMRPEKAPLEALAKTLAEQQGAPQDWRRWHERLRGGDGVREIAELARDLRVGAARGATVLLPIDQLEELFTIAEPEERAGFVALLTGLLDPGRDLPVMAVATGRADVLQGLLETSGLAPLIDPVPLLPMPLDRVPRLIEGPAAVASLIIEPGLSEHIARDVETAEALPLLAQTLRLLHDRCSRDKRLTLAAYAALGDAALGLNPVQNSVRLAADEAIAALRPNAAELEALRDAFIPHLVRLRLDEGRRVRQPAPLAALPPEAARPIRALTEARLLVRRSEDGEPVVEVAHEALFAAWPTLARWLDEEQQFLADIERVKSAAAVWAEAAARDKPRALLHGLLLANAREAVLRHPQRFRGGEMARLRGFIAESAAAADAAQARAERLRRRVLQATLAASVILLLASLVSLWLYLKAEDARRAEAEQTKIAQQQRDRAEAAQQAEAEQRKLAQQQRDLALAAQQAEAEQRKLAQEQRDLAQAAQQAEAEQRKLAQEQRDLALAAQQAEAEQRTLAQQQRDLAQAAQQAEAEQRKLAQQQRDLAQAAQQAEAEQRKLAQEQRDRAERTLDLATETANSLVVYLAHKFQAAGIPIAVTKEILDRARGLQDQLAAGGEASPALRRGQAGAFLVTADTLLEMGDTEGALAAASKARDAAQELLAIDPTDTDFQHFLAVSFTTIGAILMAQGNLPEALKAFRESVTIDQQLVTSEPGNADFQFGLSASYNLVGDVLSRQDHLSEALTAFRDSLAIRQRLAEADPKNPMWLNGLSTSFGRIGNVLESEGKLAEALKSYQEGLNVMRRLAEAEPADTGLQRDLAVAYGQVGTVLQGQGNLPEALESFRDELGISQGLAAADPGNATKQRNLSVGYSHLGKVLMLQGNLTEALKSFQDGLSIIQRLAGADPGNAEWQRDLAILHGRIGDVLMAQDKLAEALTSFRDGVSISQRLAGADPANTEAQRDLWLSLTKVGDALWQQGNAAEALAAYRDGLAICKIPVERDPQNTGSLNDLAYSYDKILSVLEKTGDLAAVLPVYRDSIAVQKRLLERDPANEEWRSALVGSFLRLSWALLLSNQPREALDASQRALDLDPSSLSAAMHRAHSLLLLGQFDPARNAYLANKKKKFSDGTSFGAALINDLSEMRKHKINTPEMHRIEILFHD